MRINLGLKGFCQLTAGAFQGETPRVGFKQSITDKREEQEDRLEQRSPLLVFYAGFGLCNPFGLILWSLFRFQAMQTHSHSWRT